MMTKIVIGFYCLISLSLINASLASAPTDPIKPKIKKQMSDYKISEKKETKPDYTFGAILEASRGTGLYDFKDGSRSDSLDFLFLPSLKTPIGKFSIQESYSINLRDEQDTSAGFSDASLSYSVGAVDWDWSPPYIITLAPSFTTIIPISEVSVKRTQLQTALSTGLSLSVRPDHLSEQKYGTWNFAISISAGRSFHAYEEDINGTILNKYFSNQSVSMGYTISDWSFSFNYTNRSRWTYQGNLKQSFVMSEEISYSISEKFYTTIGHSNDAPSVLKANGFESNVQIIDENNSSVYLSIGSIF